MEKAFEILVDSRNRYETGEPGGVWLSMPTTTEQLHEAMKSVGITADNPQDFFINSFANTEDCPFDVPLEVIQRGSMDELNYLGKLLSMQSVEDKSKFTAAVTLGKRAGNLKDLINLAQNLDCYWIYPTVRSEEDYGYYLIDELDELELPAEAKKYFMYEEYGRDAAINDGGRFTEQGYVCNNKNTFTEWYDGRDVPEEYCIMSYPQPPTRPDSEKADFDADVQTETLTAEPPQPLPVIPLILTADKPAEKLKEITNRLEQGISELFESDRYKEYLSVMSKFYNYSVRNTVLIAMQKPDASLIACFNAWKNEFGRNVKRGEKGIRIIATLPFKVKKEEVTIPAFKVVAVFDVSQTEGRELPNLAVDALMGDVDKYKDFFAALEKTSPVPVDFEKVEGGAHGYYHLEEERITLNEGESQLQSLKTLIHEIAHAKLHSIDLNIPPDEQLNRHDRRTHEVEAESIAYTVCQHYGLDTLDYSFGYVAEWSSGKELIELKKSLETIRRTAADIINSVDGHFAELQKAQGRKQEQPTQPQEQNNTTATQLTALEQKAVEIAQQYEKLSMQDRIDVIAQAFGCTTGKIETSPCTGKWRGTSDMSIKFDNGMSLFIGNHSTPKTKTAKVQNEFVNSALVQYNPEIISAAKETAVTALMQREAKDNAIAAQRGLKPYTFLNVEFNDGSDDKSSRHKGWYFVTLAVDGKIRAHIETGLNHDIASGKVSENITRDNYFVAGALKGTDVDYVFNNVGFSSTTELYSLHISDDVWERAEKTLAERVAADIPDKQAIGQQTEPTTTAPYYPTNNNTEIHLVKSRIQELTQKKAVGFAGWEFAGGRVKANTEANRLQIFFDEKPDEATRAELKSNGFRWSPKEEAWQRQLTDNAYYAANYVKAIQPLTGEKPTELQRAHIWAENAKQKKTTDTEYIYMVHSNPRSDSRDNLYLLQAYIPQEDGKAKIGDVLYIGTPEKCRELMGQLNVGELTQGQVKELYAKAQEQPKAPEPPTQEAEPDKDTFTIYQLKGGDETRDFRFESYDRLQAAGLAVDPANYANIYTAPLESGMSLEGIFERFNIDHPKDFKGHSLSVSDVVVLHQNGQDTAHYVDSIGYRQVPEFLQEQKQLIPDDYKTGEKISTPRGTFSLTDMTHEQMNEAGYHFHHQSDDGKYHIMANGTRAFAIAAEQPEKVNPIKHVEDTIEQNDNNFDGIINNTPTVDELEANRKDEEQISLTDLATAIKIDREKGKEAELGKKPSIRAQLKADKERAKKKPTKSKSQDLERS